MAPVHYQQNFFVSFKGIHCRKMTKLTCRSSMGLVCGIKAEAMQENKIYWTRWWL